MADKEVKPQQGSTQKVLIAVAFDYFKKEDGGRGIGAKLDVDYNPKIPMLDPHKRDYGVKDLQAAAASLPGKVERMLEERGYTVMHPGKGNKAL